MPPSVDEIRAHIDRLGGMSEAVAASGVARYTIRSWLRGTMSPSSTSWTKITSAVPIAEPMSREEFGGIVEHLGGPTSTARYLGLSVSTVQRYQSGVFTVPLVLAARARKLGSQRLPPLRRPRLR